MNAITPGLRRLYNRTNAVAKVEVRVQPGDEIQVPADVADGLLSALDCHFSSVADVKPAPPAKPAAPAEDVKHSKGH
tara:strand:+ start:312 stop:542 length:231 start_codon:yes stop_codon:yes gene_type:complete